MPYKANREEEIKFWRPLLEGIGYDKIEVSSKQQDLKDGYDLISSDGTQFSTRLRFLDNYKNKPVLFGRIPQEITFRNSVPSGHTTELAKLFDDKDGCSPDYFCYGCVYQGKILHYVVVSVPHLNALYERGCFEPFKKRPLRNADGTTLIAVPLQALRRSVTGAEFDDMELFPFRSAYHPAFPTTPITPYTYIAGK